MRPWLSPLLCSLLALGAGGSAQAQARKGLPADAVAAAAKPAAAQ